MKRSFILGGFASLAAMAVYSTVEGSGGPLTFNNLDKSIGADKAASTTIPTSAADQETPAGILADQPSSRVRTLEDSLKAQQVGSVAEVATLGRSGKVTLVHMKDHEGVLAIDTFSGAVIPSEDAPEWAEERGLVMAMLGERHLHYSKALGGLYTPDLRVPDAIAFEDLDWLAINPETGEDQVISADDEHRMDVKAAILGIDRSEEDGVVATSGATVELSYDNSRTGDEMQAFTDAGGKVFATEEQRKAAQG